MDKRADKIYSAEIQKGLTHKNYPAIVKKMILGIKFSSYQTAPIILEEIENFQKKNTVFFIPATVETPFTRKVVNLLFKKKIPFLHYNLLNSKLLLPTIERSNNPIRAIHRYFLAKNKQRHLENIKYLLSTRDNSFDLFLEKFKNYSQLDIFEFSLGIDLSFWTPHMPTQEAKEKLEIPENDFVILLSQRVVPNYQLDKFIHALAEVNTDKKISCYISGFCEPSYKEYLELIIQEKKLTGRVHLLGYISNALLKDYYAACNLFATVPILFAGSHSAIKAMAMEKPIMHVNLGSTYKFLEKHHAGIFVEPYKYEDWTAILKQIVSAQKEVHIVAREKVIEQYSWEQTAKRILAVANKINQNE